MKYTWFSLQWYSCYSVCLCYLDMHYVFCLKFHLSFCFFRLSHLSLFRTFNHSFTWPWKMLCYTLILCRRKITVFHIHLLKFVKADLNLSLEIVTNRKSDPREGKGLHPGTVWCTGRLHLVVLLHGDSKGQS